MTHQLPAEGSTTMPPDDDTREATDPRKACPACGAHNDAIAQFCVVCGAALIQATEVADEHPGG